MFVVVVGGGPFSPMIVCSSWLCVSIVLSVWVVGGRIVLPFGLLTNTGTETKAETGKQEQRRGQTKEEEDQPPITTERRRYGETLQEGRHTKEEDDSIHPPST